MIGIMWIRFIKKINIPNKVDGFTLMETVVATALFITATIILVDIFVIAQRTQRKLENQTKVQLDARYTLDFIASEIRRSKIDYEYILSNGGFPGNPNDYLEYLPLINSFGDRVLYQKKTSGEGICDGGATNCLAVKRQGSDFANITPRGVEVESVRFYIDPQEDPFKVSTTTWDYPEGGSYGFSADAFTIQPRVTVTFITKTVDASDLESSVSYLQTTVTTRTYDRYQVKQN